MSTVWNKLDLGLASIYSRYRRSREAGSAGAMADRAASAPERVNASLYYSGALSDIEALGFKTAAAGPAPFASGSFDLANLEQIAAHPGVLKLSVGEARSRTLDLSVPNIRANEVWTRSGPTFANWTGKGVIVGIIDTGIDIFHPFFFTTTEPKRTRILRIWDQGLEAQDGDERPDVSLLTGGISYGVEYDHARIAAGLGGLGNFRHHDGNDGHGTHVASIAAGNGQDKFKYIGVAPEADLIIVKHLELEKIPQYGGADVSDELRFRDAVAYILNVAKNVYGDRPVVINASFSNSIGPHDGLTSDEDFLTHTFATDPGRCFVAGAGNEGVSLQHTTITLPAGGGTAVLPMYLYNEATKNTVAYPLSIRLFYRPTETPVTVELKLPDKTVVAGPALGDGPLGPVEFAEGRTYEMFHSSADDVLAFTGRGVVRRSRFDVTFRPNAFGHHVANRYYFLTVGTPATIPGSNPVRATEEVVIHLWCTQAPSDQGFRIGGFGMVQTPPNPPISGTTLELAGDQVWALPNPADGPFTLEVYAPGHLDSAERVQVTARPEGILTIVRAQDTTNARAIQAGDGVLLALPKEAPYAESHQIGDTAGAENVIGVAAYDAETASLPLCGFSSRGPLATYELPPGVQQPSKPDIAAPGKAVDAARSQGRIGLSKKRRPTQPMQGTSMAAPHVTGTVALMLQKNPHLTTQKIIGLLKANVRVVIDPVTPLPAVEAGAGRLDAKQTVDKTT